MKGDVRLIKACAIGAIVCGCIGWNLAPGRWLLLAASILGGFAAGYLAYTFRDIARIAPAEFKAMMAEVRNIQKTVTIWFRREWRYLRKPHGFQLFFGLMLLLFVAEESLVMRMHYRANAGFLFFIGGIALLGGVLTYVFLTNLVKSEAWEQGIYWATLSDRKDQRMYAGVMGGPWVRRVRLTYRLAFSLFGDAIARKTKEFIARVVSNAKALGRFLWEGPMLTLFVMTAILFAVVVLTHSRKAVMAGLYGVAGALFVHSTTSAWTLAPAKHVLSIMSGAFLASAFGLLFGEYVVRRQLLKLSLVK
jgi:hypothetical protein